MHFCIFYNQVASLAFKLPLMCYNFTNILLRTLKFCFCLYMRDVYNNFYFQIPALTFTYKANRGHLKAKFFTCWESFKIVRVFYQLPNIFIHWYHSAHTKLWDMENVQKMWKFGWKVVGLLTFFLLYTNKKFIQKIYYNL